jgi:hypothetical protein
MTSNSANIIQEIRHEFSMLIDYVTNESAHQATAYEIERGLFAWLLQLGAQLLTLFFVTRAEDSARTTVELADGTELPYHSDKKRDYHSVFGSVPVWRPYFYTRGQPGHYPLDAALSLGEDSYSDFLRELSEYLGVHLPYATTRDIEARFLGLMLSTRTQQQLVIQDAQDVEAYYTQKPAPCVSTEAEILVIQADGKGVPIVRDTPTEASVRLGKGQKRGQKKEAIVTTVYTIAPTPRTPEAVVASFFQEETATRTTATTPPKPQHKHLWATLAGKDTALMRLRRQVTPRRGAHITHRVALCDGCEALQTRLQTYFPDFQLLLDFIHPNEYLWDTANALLGESHEERTAWVKDKTLLMLQGRTQQLIDEFQALAAQNTCTSRQREQLHKTANYFQRNLPYMDYATYLARGWPIASGVIEGACRHFVKDRCELSGMRWTYAGAENLLQLRAVAVNGDWDTYHAFRRQRRHARLYATPFPETALDDLATTFTATQTVQLPIRAGEYAYPTAHDDIPVAA